MRNILLFAAFVCFATLHVSAQTTESETTPQRYLRLSKNADKNPTDWKAQLEMAHFLLDKSSTFYNQQRGADYYERIYHIATDFNKEIPDSIIQETGMALMTAAVDRKNLDKALFYINEMKHAKTTGADIKDDFLNMCDLYAVLYNMAKEDELKALVNLMDLRERATKMGLTGIEYSDVMTSMMLDNVVSMAKKMYGDRLLEITMDGKKYVAVAMGDWNIERPFVGWTSGNDGEGEKKSTLFYAEDGVVYDNVHGEMEFSFNCNKDGIAPQEGYNTRLITVTPERRQQMVEAYRNYMKKAKKEKK